MDRQALAAILVVGLFATKVLGEVYPQWDKLPLYKKITPTNIVKRVSWKYFKRKKYSQAIKVLDIGAQYISATELELTKARLFIELGKIEEARIILTPFMQENIQSKTTDNEVAKTLAEFYMAQGRFQEAKTNLSKARDPSDEEITYLLAKVYFLTKEDAEANKMIEKLNAGPLKKEATLLKLQILKRVNNITQIAKTLEEIEKEADLSFEENFMLTHAYQLQGQWEKAQKQIQKNLGADLQTSKFSKLAAQYVLAKSYFKLGKMDASLKMIAHLKESSSENLALNLMCQFLEGKILIQKEGMSKGLQVFTLILDALDKKFEAKVKNYSRRKVASQSDFNGVFPAIQTWQKLEDYELVKILEKAKSKEKKFAPLLSELFYLQADFEKADFYRAWAKSPN